MPPEVAATFNDWPEPLRRELFILRDLILATASETDGVGEITETLKWGAKRAAEARFASLRPTPSRRTTMRCSLFAALIWSTISAPGLATLSNTRANERCCLTSATVCRLMSFASVCGQRLPIIGVLSRCGRERASGRVAASWLAASIHYFSANRPSPSAYPRH